MKPSSLLLLLLAPLAARADAPVLRVEVDAAAATQLDVAAVAGDVAEELDVHVILEGTAPARVTVRAEGADTVSIVYERDDGTRRERVVQLPGERGESTRTVVLLVSNLARDQVGLAPPTTTEGAASEPVPAEVAPVVVAPVVVAPAQVTPAEAEAAAAAEGPARPPRAPKRTPEQRRWHLGAGVIAGAATVASETVPFYVWGIDVGWRLGDNMAVGLAHLSISAGFNSEGEGNFMASGTPYFELAAFATPRLQPYGRVGLLVQSHTGSFYRPEGWFEAAPYAGGGARLFVTKNIAIGLEVGAHLVVTDQMNLGSATLSRWSIPGTIGLSTTLNF